MSSIFQDLENDVAFIGAIAAQFSSSKAAQTIEQYATLVLVAVASQKASFTVGAYTVTAKLNGTPAAFSVGAAFQAYENIEAGKLGAFTSGDLEIDIQETNPPATPAVAAA